LPEAEIGEIRDKWPYLMPNQWLVNVRAGEHMPTAGL
jgi:hypothetical protein